MSKYDLNHSAPSQRQSLLTLCRFVVTRLMYRLMLLLLSVTGLFLTLSHRTQFAPYGIVLLCLLLPAFLNDSLTSRLNPKKENNDTPLHSLYRRYHYSPIVFTEYRISLLLCMLLLLIWHKVQSPALTLFGASLPLLYIVLCLALYSILSRGLFLILHHRLMNGKL